MTPKGRLESGHRCRHNGGQLEGKSLSELKKKSWAHTYNLDVTVSNGCVDLWGYAQSNEERNAIRVAAESIPEVVAVNVHLADSPVYAY